MNSLVKGAITVTTILGAVLAASPATYATNMNESCVDGTVRSNLSVAWKDAGNVTVGTVNDKPLCEDVKLFFSSYTMPDNYNGEPFMYNPTAVPQTKFDTITAVLEKGQTTPVAMTIDLPAACKNMQVDIYYGPEVTTVEANAHHGDQYITGKIIEKTQESCAPVVPEETEEPVEETPAPVVPEEEAQTPPTPEPEVVVEETPEEPAVEEPVELPRTGGEVAGVLSASATLALLAYFGAAYVRSIRRM